MHTSLLQPFCHSFVCTAIKVASVAALYYLSHERSQIWSSKLCVEPYTCCLQAAAQQAHADRVTAVAEAERRQQALQDQLVMARVAERLGQAQNKSQAELSAVRADCDRQLSRMQAEHGAHLEVVNADLQQTKAALHEVLGTDSMHQ